MKIISKIFIPMIVFFAFSCEDTLKETPIDAISSEYLFSSEDGLNAGVNGLYNLMRGLNYAGGTGGLILGQAGFRIGTDLGLARVATDWMYDPTRFHPTGPVPHPWNTYYSIINRANSIIAEGPSVDMDAVKRDVLIAQARAMRAEVYMELYTVYHNIIFNTEPITSENIDDIDYSVIATADEVWDLVDSDLDFAISKLDWVVESGRYGQAAVRYLRGCSAAWQEDWQAAADQFDAIVENGTHHLVALDEVFTGDRNNAESLLTYQFNRELGGSDNLAGGGPTAFAAFFINRYYELTSGELVPDAKYGGLTYGWSFPNDYLRSLYDKENDQRYLTYYFDQDAYVVNNPESPTYGQPLPDSSKEDNFRRFHWSLKKFFDPDKPATSDQSYQNYIHYRFAEVLLFGAEAHWKLSGNNSDPKALEYINMVRRRAFGGDASFDFTSIDQESFLEEHAREMALEHSRWFLLKRLGILSERVSLHFEVGSNSGNVQIRQMPKYMENWPIPQSQIDVMPGFPQNEGYVQ